MHPGLPLVPFPPLSWWQVARQGSGVWVDLAETYQKQTLRNRLLLADAKGEMVISLPIDHGYRRLQSHLPMSQMRLSGHIPVRQMMRAIQTAYGRSPFFEHVMPELEQLVAQHGPCAAGATLGGFARASIQMMVDWADDGLSSNLTFTMSPSAGRKTADQELELLDSQRWEWPRYGQPFEDRNGFLPGRSSLDALFCVGPAWTAFLPRLRQD